MKLSLPFSILTLLCEATMLVSCGEDRSGEQPFAPTVKTETAMQVADSVQLSGIVLSSPNSHLLECGFEYGNDTLRAKKQAETLSEFSAFTDSLGKGNYYAVAYARNGVGIGYGDTIRFCVE